MASKTVIIYGIETSPPVRSTLMAAHAYGIGVDFRLIDTHVGQHKTPEFLKINPQHSIPTLEDDGFIVWDSHAIITYLANQYGKGGQYYPNDPKVRALIDQRLHFDSGVLFNRLMALATALFSESKGKLDPDLLVKITEAYDFLETFLSNSTWLVGEKSTLADISMVATISTAEFLTPFDKTKYPKLLAWLTRCKSEPWYAANLPGLEKISQMALDRAQKQTAEMQSELENKS